MNASYDLIHVTFKFDHHGKHSGYDKLTEEVEPGRSFYLKKIDGKKLFLIFKNKIAAKVISEINIGWAKLINKDIINYVKKSGTTNTAYLVHYLYPENTLIYNYDAFPTNAIVVSTFHQPIEWFEGLTSSKKTNSFFTNLRKTDYGIAMSSDQIHPLEQVFGKGKIRFIPHGVSTDFFVPGTAKTVNPTIITVGNWLRDYDLLATVAAKMFKLRPEATFTIIANEEWKAKFQGLKNVNFLFNISDDELLNQFQQATCLLLPLKKSTANNAILEAMSCGLPILVTHSQAALDYTDESCALYFANTEHEVIQQLEFFLEDKNLQYRMSQAARQNALKFDWRIIAGKHAQYYNEIIGIDR